MVSCSIPNPVRPAEKKYDYFHWTDEKTEAQKRNLFFFWGHTVSLDFRIAHPKALIFLTVTQSLWSFPLLRNKWLWHVVTMCKQRSIFSDEAHRCLCQRVSVCWGCGWKTAYSSSCPRPFSFWLLQHYLIHPILRSPAQVSICFNWRNSVFTLNSWHFKQVQ